MLRNAPEAYYPEVYRKHHQMLTFPFVTLFRMILPTKTISRMITERTEAFWVSASTVISAEHTAGTA